MQWLRKAADLGVDDAYLRLAKNMYRDRPYARDAGLVVEPFEELETLVLCCLCICIIICSLSKIMTVDVLEPRSELRKVQVLPTSKVLGTELDMFINELRVYHSNITLETLCFICIDIMLKVQKFNSVSGADKKAIVIHVIHKLIDNVDDELYVKYEIIIEK